MTYSFKRHFAFGLVCYAVGFAFGFMAAIVGAPE